MSEEYVCPPTYISEELIIGILKRLPAKSLLRFMCVSNFWYSLIKSPIFISTHFNHQKKKPKYLMYCDAENHDDYYVHADDESLDIHLQFTGPYMFNIMGCCDGLVCFNDLSLETTTSFVLWNSSLRRSLDIKVPHCTTGADNDIFTQWFGFDAVSNDYKFVWVGYSITASFETRTVGVYIYSLNERTWRCVDSYLEMNDECVIMFRGVYLNGVIHWGGKRRDEDHNMPEFILTFDLADDTFSALSLPSEVYNLEPSYDHVGQVSGLMTMKIGSKNCLAILCLFSTDLDIWVMEEEGIVDSWRKEIVIQTDFYINKILNFRMNGELMMHVDEGGAVSTNGIASIDLRCMTMELLSTDDYDYVGTYMESLVLL